ESHSQPRMFSQVRGGAASGNRTPDLLITSESRHCHHLGKPAGSSTSAVPTRPGTSAQELPRLPLSSSLTHRRRGHSTPRPPGAGGVPVCSELGRAKRVSRRVGELASKLPASTRRDPRSW